VSERSDRALRKTSIRAHTKLHYSTQLHLFGSLARLPPCSIKNAPRLASLGGAEKKESSWTKIRDGEEELESERSEIKTILGGLMAEVLRTKKRKKGERRSERALTKTSINRAESCEMASDGNIHY